MAPGLSQERHSIILNVGPGAGLKEEDEGTFEDAVRKKCPYYYELVDIMSDRASSKPKVTSYDLDDDDDEDGMSDDDDKSVSDISDGGDGNDDKSQSTKRTATTAATTSSKKAKKPSKKRASPVMDDKAITALSEASKASEAKMKEMVRHNQFLEKLEEKKLVLEQKREERESTSWRGKSDELDYKMKLLQRYTELRDVHHFSDDQIVAFYPDMKQIVEAKTNQK